jgi:hypothetical protein
MDTAFELSSSTPVAPGKDTEVGDDDRIGPSGPRIRCPPCGWSVPSAVETRHVGLSPSSWRYRSCQVTMAAPEHAVDNELEHRLTKSIASRFHFTASTSSTTWLELQSESSYSGWVNRRAEALKRTISRRPNSDVGRQGYSVPWANSRQLHPEHPL